MHHRLIEAGLRCDANIVVETATARDPHHIAVLLGFGATCVYPYLAYEVIQGMARRQEIDSSAASALEQNYRKGINKGLLKVLSKMGISTIASYRGAQLFEIVGLHDEIVRLCFPGTTSRVQGAGYSDLTEDMQSLADHAFNQRRKTKQGGVLKYIDGGEYHAYNPDVVNSLQAAVTSGVYSDYEIYANHVDQREPAMLRDLLKINSPDKPISIDEVEPAAAIISRFDSAGMSLSLIHI